MSVRRWTRPSADLIALDIPFLIADYLISCRNLHIEKRYHHQFGMAPPFATT